MAGLCSCFLSQACLETGRPVQSIEFQKEIFHHNAATEKEQSNSANLVTMSYLNLKSIDETDRYIKSLEYAVFDGQALEIAMDYFKEQIKNKNFAVIDKIYKYYRTHEVHDKSKLKFLEVFCELNNSKIEAEEQVDHNTTSMNHK